MNFLDEAKIYIKSGNGGNGSTSFRREKFVPNGGPDGGNGGRGGSIIISSTSSKNTLINFRYKQHFSAENGESGKGKSRSGRAASNLFLEVPVGTQIFDETGENIIFDFDLPDQEYEILKGGRGGLGNINFKSSTNQSPTFAQKGESGKEMWIWLKLKLLSDVGIIGLPNAGKSTLLSVITSAKPKIADYPFTTIVPNLGVVRYDDFEFTIADIPGLIEGAHMGVGLGDRFLKHIERCKVLLHLIDVTSDDITHDYNVVRKELSQYSPILAQKQHIIVFNKIDAVNQEKLDHSLSLFSKQEVTVISAAGLIGIEKLLQRIKNLLCIPL